MEEAPFIEQLEALGLPSENAYEDLSARGLHLWNNYELSIGVDCHHSSEEPLLELIVWEDIGEKYPKYTYVFCDLSQFTSATLAHLLEKIKQDYETIRNEIVANQQVRISVDQQEFLFAK